MHSMLARYSRGETATVSILARAHDLRYEAQVHLSLRLVKKFCLKIFLKSMTEAIHCIQPWIANLVDFSVKTAGVQIASCLLAKCK